MVAVAVHGESTAEKLRSAPGSPVPVSVNVAPAVVEPSPGETISTAVPMMTGSSAAAERSTGPSFSFQQV